MNNKRQYVKHVLLLFIIMLGIWVKDICVEAQEYPVLMPDGDAKASTIIGYDDLPTFQLEIDKDGYYLFEDANGKDTRYMLLAEDESWFHYIGSSCYISKGTYHLLAENRSDKTPEICVKTVANYEFDFSNIQDEYVTDHLYYDPVTILENIWEKVSVKVIISDYDSYETTLCNASVCPLLYWGGTLAAGMPEYDDMQFWNVEQTTYCSYNYIYDGSSTIDIQLRCMGKILFSKNITVKTPSLDDLDVYTQSGEISVLANTIKIIKVKPEHTSDYILINQQTLNLNYDYDDEKSYICLRKRGIEEYFEDDKYNLIYGFDEDQEYFIEIENESKEKIDIIFAEVLDKKVVKMPEKTQNTTGTETAGWVFDNIYDDVVIALVTPMGEYNVGLNSARLGATMRNPNAAGYAETSVEPLSHGDKLYFIVYENGEDGAEIELARIEITINDTTYKPDSQPQQDDGDTINNVHVTDNNTQNVENITNNTNATIDNTNTTVDNSNSTSVTVGAIIEIGDAKYTVTANENGQVTVTYTAPENVKQTSITVPDTVTLSDGTVAKVTEIAPNAFKKCKKLKKVTIGTNIEKIGKNAFNGCKNLKTITIKTTKLTKKSFGKNAFKGIGKKATIKVPKKQYKNYKKWLKNAGLPKGVKIKKN